MTSKSVLRSAALSRRSRIGARDRARAAEALADRRSQLEIAPGALVAGYWPIRDEFDPMPLLRALAREGCALSLPAVLDPRTLAFRRWIPGEDLVATGYGTRGPGPMAAVVDPEIMLVPTAAYDRVGGRIGYGAGFYDRAIAALISRGHAPRLCGIAFSCQQVAAVPLEPHDQLLHMVATESEIICCR